VGLARAAATRTCVALVTDSISLGSASGWDADDVDASDSDPAEAKAGDYLGAVRNGMLFRGHAGCAPVCAPVARSRQSATTI